MSDYARETLATLGVVVLGIIIGLVFVEIVQAERSPLPRVCFPAERWNANDAKRPCVEIELYEDGTFRSNVEQANGHPWQSR